MRKIIVAIVAFSSLLHAQNKEKYPKDFISPLQIPISLSANYSELRKNHFHAGLDMRTQQRIGLKVVAPQEGYVSRINIAAYGYGKAIYITHPNGYTTVYGHLSALVGDIEARTREEQYKNKSYSVDFYLKPNELPVKQGELIALSGNTGGSGGPHLHFEVRDSKTEEVLNPFLFGFDIPDHVKPQVNGVWIYPVHGTVNGGSQKLMVNPKIGTYTVSGQIGFGVKAYDKQDASNNLNGIYSIKTYVNDELISTFKADKHAFDETRFINASTDYPDVIGKNSWIYRTYLLPGNTLQMYEQTENNGILKVEKGAVYRVKIEVGDYAGNTTTRSFTLKGVEYEWKGEERRYNPSLEKYKVDIMEPYSFSEDGVSINFEKGSFYEGFQFNYKKLGANKYQLHNSAVPVHKRYELSITPDWSELDRNQADKYMIVRDLNFGTGKKEYLKTTYKDGKYYASPRDLGIFSLVLENTVPTISCPAFAKTNKIGNRLSFIIKDTGSGINTYDVYIDGKWVLAEYEYKNSILFIPDLNKEGIEKGPHQVEVIVTDEVNNKRTYTQNFEKL